MKPEDQTCSKESGARLVELGVTVESFFAHSWIRTRVKTKDGFGWGTSPVIRFGKGARTDDRYAAPAYTVAELGKIMKGIPEYLVGNALQSGILANLNHIDYGSWFAGCLFEMLTNPDLICEVIIWLLENGHITAEEINNG